MSGSRGSGGFSWLELKHAKAELEAKEKIISEFKQQHLGELPQQIDEPEEVRSFAGDIRSHNEQSQSLANRLVQLDKSIKDYEETGGGQ